jgi:DNA-binding HxlR family transcriptional regulator
MKLPKVSSGAPVEVVSCGRVSHGKMTGAHGRWYGDACSAAFALELVGERWALLVARELMLGPLRFTDLRAALPAISAKTLTERLEWLESIGVVRRDILPPPAPARLYTLTEWGRGLEDVLQALGRWGVRSPLHDPSLPLTPVSLMLSLRTMLDRAAAAGPPIDVAFAIAGQHFAVRIADGDMAVCRSPAPPERADLRFIAAAAGELLPLFYGKRQPAPGSTLTIEGDPDLAARCIALFALPGKARG